MSASTVKQQWETRHIGYEGRAEISEGKRIVGYPIVFNRLSHNLGGFKERIAPSAVDRTLRDGLDVRAYFDHATDKVLGRTRSGTLRLDKDPHGMRAEITPPNTTLVKDLLVSIKRGDISGMSFRFMVMPGGEEWHFEGDLPIRTVTDMIVGEVSVVSEPAYEDTSVAVRSMREFQETIRRGPSVDLLRRRMKLKGAL